MNDLIPDPIWMGQISWTNEVHSYVSKNLKNNGIVKSKLRLFLLGQFGLISNLEYELNRRTLKNEGTCKQLIGRYQLQDKKRILIQTIGYGDNFKGENLCRTTISFEKIKDS